METRRLRLLVELARLGSMREVADELGTSTSTVSAQLAVLAAEVGVALVEPDGRRVRLTPAGRRLAEHAVTILAAVDAARLDLAPDAEPTGTLRVAGFATAVRRALLPIIADLARSHPGLHVTVHEYEPFEAFDLLAADRIDLALTYDYNLAPVAPEPALETTPLWSTPWALGVPDDGRTSAFRAAHDAPTTPQVFAAFADREWIGNSRNTADEVVVRAMASLSGFTPRIAHEADSLDLVEDLVVAGLGVGMLPAARVPRPGVRLLPLDDPPVTLRAYAVIRRGRAGWPPLALVLGRLTRR